MSADVRIRVGGSALDDAAAFVTAWHRAEGGATTPERILSFETWDAMVSVLSVERFRLLRHLHAHPEPSVSALARGLNRQYRRVHADVVALEDAGLIERTNDVVRATADVLRAEIRLQVG